MTISRRVALAALPGLAFIRPLRAQDTPCPTGKVCVDYKDQATIEIDPALGYLQVICVAEIVTTTTSFDGTTTAQQVQLAEYLSDGDTYDLAGVHTVAKDGRFAEASLGDVFLLGEVTS